MKLLDIFGEVSQQLLKCCRVDETRCFLENIMETLDVSRTMVNEFNQSVNLTYS